MYPKFNALETDKRQRIINAALAEFASRGYRQASTDRIVAAAGISKGALFHYFGSKEKLYLFLLDWTAETMEQQVWARLDMSDPDLFSRFLQASRVKMEVLREHPYLWKFWDSFEYEQPEIAAGWMQRHIDLAVPRTAASITDGIDVSRFKPGLDLGKAVSAIAWMFGGWADAKWAEARRRGTQVEPEELFAEANEYVEFLRSVFYTDRPEERVSDRGE